MPLESTLKVCTSRYPSRSSFGTIQRVPLRPPLLDGAVRVERVEAVAPHAGGGGGEDVGANRAREPREPRRNRSGQPELSTLRDENAVGRFGEDAGIAAEREAGLGERLVPAPDDVVRARTDGARNHTGSGLRQQRRGARDQDGRGSCRASS